MQLSLLLTFMDFESIFHTLGIVHDVSVFRAENGNALMWQSLSTVVKTDAVFFFFFFKLRARNTCKINDSWGPCFVFLPKIMWALNLKSLKFCALETGKKKFYHSTRYR